MTKDFISELDKSYSIPKQLAIQSEKTPTDMRFNCDTIEDFQTIADAGMEIRYHGLITTETSTGLTKVCKLVDGNFVWETLGAKGDTGERGPQGIQGEKGEKGDTGDRGLQGEVGPVGPRGPVGEKGDTGATGPAGPQGEAGAKGEKGDTGATGATGPIGPQGEKGEKGDSVQVDDNLTSTSAINALSSNQGKLLNEKVELVKDMLGGKALRYVTQAEYDTLSEEQKSDANIVWNITDSVSNEGSLDTSIYQLKEDNTLQTTDKTIVGAINELNSRPVATGNITSQSYDSEIVYIDGINYKAVKSITLDKEVVELNKGTKTIITATVSPADANNKTITWSSSNSNVTLVPNGLSCSVKGTVVGNVTVTATTQEKNLISSCEVTVKEISVEDIKLISLNSKGKTNTNDVLEHISISDNTMQFNSFEEGYGLVDGVVKFKKEDNNSLVITIPGLNEYLRDKDVTVYFKYKLDELPTTDVDNIIAICGLTWQGYFGLTYSLNKNVITINRGSTFGLDLQQCMNLDEHVIALSTDITTNDTKIYIDGVLVGEKNHVFDIYNKDLDDIRIGSSAYRSASFSFSNLEVYTEYHDKSKITENTNRINAL